MIQLVRILVANEDFEIFFFAIIYQDPAPKPEDPCGGLRLLAGQVWCQIKIGESYKNHPDI